MENNWAPLVAETVKNLPAMQGPLFNPLVGKIPWRSEMAAHSSILAWRIPWMKIIRSKWKIIECFNFIHCGFIK